MLSKNQESRFQSIQEVAGRLDECLTRQGEVGSSALFHSRLGRRLAVVLAAVLVVSVIGWWMFLGGSSDGPVVSSIAVLPLANLSGDPEQEYFVDGMTEALITDLSKIGALKVISRSSAMRYKGMDKSLAEIAQELNVEAVIEGSVLREEDQVRITARLIEAETGQNLWADRYERNLTSILALQGEVAQAIAREIQVTLTPGEESLLSRRRQVNPEAYDACLKGMAQVYKLTPASLDRALQYFELALDEDPDYAMAYAGVSFVWMARATATVAAALPDEAIPMAREAASRSIELDSALAEPHFALAGVATWYDWDWVTAEREFTRALEINPNYSDAHVFYGLFLTGMKSLPEARAHLGRALELDPLNFMYQTYLGKAFERSRRFDEAIIQYERGLSLEPGFVDALSGLLNSYHAKGMYDDALDSAKRLFVAKDENNVLAALEGGYLDGGYSEAMRRAAETLAAPLNSAYALRIAKLYTFAGEKEQALEWLEKGYQKRLQNMVYLDVSPKWDPLRKDPRFEDLIDRMNFPE
jgi:TolB-like protein/Tfp pilus assembly protein PilF